MLVYQIFLLSELGDTMDPEIDETIIDLARDGLVNQAIEYGQRIGMGTKKLAELITEGLSTMPAISI